MLEPLIPYNHNRNEPLISVSDAIAMIRTASDKTFMDIIEDPPFTEALRSGKVKAIAANGGDMYALPPIFWDVSENSSFSVGTFHALLYGVVGNMVDKERIHNLHHIQGWPILFDKKSFKAWVATTYSNEACKEKRAAHRPNKREAITDEYKRRKDAGVLCGDWHTETDSLMQCGKERDCTVSIKHIRNKVIQLKQYTTDFRNQQQTKK